MKIEKKKKLLMLAPHDPAIDPRIKWEASSAANQFEITLLGYEETFSDLNNRLNFIRYLLSASSFFNKLVLFLFGLLLSPVFFLAKLSSYKTNALEKYETYDPKNKISWKTQLEFDLRSLLWFAEFIGKVTDFFIKKIDCQPDIVHCNDIFSLITGLILKKRFGCKVIYDAHEFIPCSDPRAGRFQSIILKLFEGFLIQKVDHAVTVNPFLAEVFKKTYKLKQVFSVPNAAPVQKIDKKAGEISRLGANKVKFIFQGNFAPCRGIEAILTAWKAIDPNKAALFLIGPESSYKKKYENLAEELQILGKSAHFLPAVAPNEVINCCSEADIGIIPYTSDVFAHIYACPNKLSEFMQAGLMILANQSILYVSQILEQGKCGLSFDLNYIEPIFIRAIEDIELRQTCKSNARAYAESKYHWDQFYPVLEGLYHG